MSFGYRAAAKTLVLLLAVSASREAEAQVGEGQDTFGRVVVTATSRVGPREAEPTFTIREVDVAAQLLPHGAQPRYPDSLRVAGVAGVVTVRFVLDRSGKPDMATFRIVSTTRPEFADAVTTAVPLGLYTPAQKGGQAVRQLVQQTFQFDIAEQQRRGGESR